jgi:hypothetical protein
MKEEKFLYYVSYTIDKVNQTMTVYYRDIPIETIEITKNMSYNPINEEVAHQIALRSDLAKELIKGEL